MNVREPWRRNSSPRAALPRRSYARAPFTVAIAAGALAVLGVSGSGNAAGTARGAYAAPAPTAATAADPKTVIPAPLGGVAVTGGNASGAILQDSGCFQTRVDTQSPATHDPRYVALPGWFKFGSRSYPSVTVNAIGQLEFATTSDAYLRWLQIPVDSGNYMNFFRGTPYPIIAPMYIGSGTKAITTYGYVTYQGSPALCVTWSGQQHVWYTAPPIISPSYTNDYQLLLVDRSDQGYEDFDIILNYGSIEFSGNNGPAPGTGFGAGWQYDSTRVELANSWGAGLLDSNPGGLVHGSLGSSQLGRYVWEVRNGQTTPSVSPGGTLGSPTLTPGGATPWGENPTHPEGEPVNTATGSYFTSTTDLSLPGIGVPFELTRAYNSADPIVGPLGPGWTHSLSASLTVQANNDVLAKSGDGQELLFTHNADGSFTGPGFGRSTLSAIAGGYELITSDQLHYRFDAQGRLTSKRDRNGQGLTLAYGGDGLIASVTDSVNRPITFTNSGGRVSQVSLPDGRHVSYGYDPSGRLETVTDTRSRLTRYTYDAGGGLKTIVDQNNHTVVDNTYGPDGRVISQLDARNKPSSFAWDPVTETSTFTDARQNQWKDVYRNNVLVERIDPLGHTTLYHYDSALNLTDVIDPAGLRWSMTYDSRGNLLSRKSPTTAPAEEWTYNAFNDPLTYKDGRTFVTNFEYDTAGNLTLVRGPTVGALGRPETVYTRDPGGTGLLTAITDPRGKQTTFVYASGNLTEIHTHLQNRTTMGYDPSGRLTTLVEARGNAAGANPLDYTWTYDYNEANQLETQRDPLGNTSTLDYDPAGNLLFREDAKLHRASYGYDEGNHLTSVTAPDPDGAGPLAAPVTGYSYDDVGNVDTRLDANLHVTDYEYDQANRVSQITYPGSRVWTYSYDANGNVSNVTDANGNATPTAGDGRTTYAYDAYSRLGSISYSDGTPSVSFTYDANGNRTQMSDGSGQETYAYDSLNRLTQVTRGSDLFLYTYDLVNLTQVRYPDATNVIYAFDDDERLQSASSGEQTTYGYDAAGNLLTTTLPSGNGYVETRSYDQAGRVTEIKNQKGSTTLSRFLLTLDPVGNPSRIDRERTGQATQTQTLTYDDMDRLTGVCFQVTCPGGSDPFIRWTYDGVGNRMSEQRPGASTTYTYNVADELTQAGATAYSYDQNGNERSAGSRTFTYDLANRLKTTALGNTTTTYTYAGDGKRLQASTGTQAAKKTNFVWDLSGSLSQVVLERDGNNAFLRRYVYGTDRISMASGSSTYYFHHGPLGSVTNLTSSAGAPQRSYVYEPFGTMRTETSEASKAPTNFMKFAGEYLDPTGLYHLRARQYDSAVGRFLTVDPAAAEMADPWTSPYAYVSNRPTVLTDPSGLRWCWEACPVYDAAKTGADVAGDAVVDVVTDPKLALAFGAMGAACALTAGTGCLAWGVAAVAISVAASAERNFFAPCGSASQFGGDVAFEAVTFGAGRTVQPIARRLVHGQVITERQAKRFLRGAPAVIFGAKQVGRNVKTPLGCGDG